MQDRYDVLLAPATPKGRELIPRLAAILDISPLSDVTSIIQPDLFERPIHAGAALMQVRLREAKKLMTVRAGRFAPTPSRDEGEARAQLIALDLIRPSRGSTLIGEEFSGISPRWKPAPIVIGVGRGVASKKLFATVDEVAQQISAVIGGTRTAVETGIVPNNVQIGQTGKTIAPRLYIALGISGAVQHLAGIKDAQLIVAINKDPNAPIFGVANYGIVGELEIVLPELQKALADNTNRPIN